MTLHVLGSGSSGNCYILEGDSEAIVLEAGIKFHDVKVALNFNLKKVKGVIVSHLHGDHAKYLSSFSQFGIPVFVNRETPVDLPTVSLVDAGTQFKAGSFTILPFELIHDVPCVGFLISHSELGRIAFITDTCYVPCTFEGLNSILIECNYSDDLLQKNIDEGKVHPVVRTHVKKGHMALSTTIDALLANDLTKVGSIILLHLSDQNGDAERFQSEVAKATGKDVYVATKGLKVKLGTTPF